MKMPHCPRCAAKLVWKKIVGGIFLGCPNYPQCAKPKRAKPRLMPAVMVPRTPEPAYWKVASAA